MHSNLFEQRIKKTCFVGSFFNLVVSWEWVGKVLELDWKKDLYLL